MYALPSCRWAEPLGKARAPLWSVPKANLCLGRHEIHVWRAMLEVGPSRIRSLWQILSNDEQERADRFRFQKDRQRFIAARGLLRTILGRYLAVEPGLLQFRYSSTGKPALDGNSSDSTLHFNLSHSVGLALYAFTRAREVGIDVEFLQPSISNERIPEQFFSPREAAAIRALPPQGQPEALLACWTRKEAYLKARGDGLAHRLDEFEVTLAPGEPAALLSTAVNPQEASRWSLHFLEPAPGYLAALAVEGHNLQLKCWQWSD